MSSAELAKPEVRSARAWRIVAALSLALVVLSIRLYELQVNSADDSRDVATQNRIRKERIPAPRGLIVDRNQRVLADTRPSFTVVVAPQEALKRLDSPAGKRSIEVLCDLVDLTPDEVVRWLRSKSRHSKLVVRRDVSFSEISRIAEIEGELPGIDREVSHVRYYPYGATAAHLIGHVGEISEEELGKRKGDGYRSGDFWGRTGLERLYENDLWGEPGERYSEVDAFGRVLGEFGGRDPRPAVSGNTLHLHLDSDLQAISESLLVGRRGAVVMMDVRSGGVRVMASAPTFDPNLFSTGIGPEEWDALNTDADHPLLNRAVQAVYAPGSTFKMVPFVMTLEDRIARYGALCSSPCKGGYAFGNRWFGCWEEAGHGRVDLEEALVQSCDVYFYLVAEEISADQLASHAIRAGFGVPTGIDLPQELTGNVPDDAWFDRRYGKGEWTQGSLLNLIIGQGEYLVTPLQAARHAAALANGGQLLKPQLVASIEHADGTIDPRLPVVTGRWEMGKRTRSRLKRAMRLVVTDSLGTARSCRIENLTLAGKTGTSENAHGAPHSWFIGYAPEEEPEVAFAIVVEGGGHGSEVAVPMARTILTAYRDLQDTALEPALLSRGEATPR